MDFEEFFWKEKDYISFDSIIMNPPFGRLGRLAS